MAVRFSALRAGRLLPPKKIPGTHFCWRLDRPQVHSAAGRIRPIEKKIHIIGTRTRDVPASSIVPQPTTPPRAAESHKEGHGSETAVLPVIMMVMVMEESSHWWLWGSISMILRDWGVSRETAKVSSVPAETRTGDFPTTSHRHCCLRQLARSPERCLRRFKLKRKHATPTPADDVVGMRWYLVSLSYQLPRKLAVWYKS
jgi:hypothetical protein